MIQHLKEQYKYDELEASSSYLTSEVFEETIKRTLSQKMGVVLMENENIQFATLADTQMKTNTITADLVVLLPEDFGDLHNVLEYVLRKADGSTDAYKSAKKLIGESETFQHGS